MKSLKTGSYEKLPFQQISQFNLKYNLKPFDIPFGMKEVCLCCNDSVNCTGGITISHEKVFDGQSKT